MIAPIFYSWEIKNMDDKKPKKPSKKELLRLIEATGYDKAKASSLARSNVEVMQDFLRMLESSKA